MLKMVYSVLYYLYYRNYLISLVPIFDSVFMARAQLGRTNFCVAGLFALLKIGIGIADITTTECEARLHVLKDCEVLYCITVII